MPPGFGGCRSLSRVRWDFPSARWSLPSARCRPSCVRRRASCACLGRARSALEPSERARELSQRTRRSSQRVSEPSQRAVGAFEHAHRESQSHLPGPPPNHALQRTEAGGRVFSAIHVLHRQPPSLSLSSLGPESLSQEVRRRSSPRRNDGSPCRKGRSPRRNDGSPLWSRRSPLRSHGSPRRKGRSPRRHDGSPLRQSSSPRHHDRAPVLCGGPEALCRRGPNHALQRTATGAPLFSVVEPCVAGACR